MALGRALRTLLTASAVDGLGDGMLAAALPLLTASLTHDPRLVALISAASYLPWLLISLPAGAIVDRSDHVRVMWFAQLGQGLVVLLLALTIAGGVVGIPVVVLSAFLVGVGDVLFTNGSQSIVPRLVDRERLPRANSVLYVAQTVMQSFAGPPLGGVLFVAAAALPFGVDAASFAASAALIATLPRRGTHSLPEARASLRTSIAEGVRWLAGHRLLRTLAVLLGVNNLAGALGQATLVLFATRTLGLSPQLFGVLFLGGAAGALLGGIAAPRIVAALGDLRCLILASATLALSYLAAGIARNGVELGIALAVGGFATVLWNVVTVSCGSGPCRRTCSAG